MNFHAVKAIYLFEMARTWRTIYQSILAPVIATSLYFVSSARRSARASLTSRVSVTARSSSPVSSCSPSDAEHRKRFVRNLFSQVQRHDLRNIVGTISYVEVLLGYVGAAATKSVIVGVIIIATSTLFVPLELAHPLVMATFLVLTAVTFSLLGFIIGIWADGFEKLQIIPLLIVMPLTFLGGTFYSVNMLPPFWQTVTLFNPVVYLVSGFRWSFYELADVGLWISFTMACVFLVGCILTVWWIFKTGYRLKA